MAKQSKRLSLRQSLHTLVAWTLVALLLWQTLWGVTRMLTQVNLAMGNSALTYEDIFRNSLRISYRLVQFIQKETPEQTTLLLAPNSPSTYNFFLYPRQAFFGDEQTLREHPEIEYVVVSDGFPGFPVSGEKMMLDSEHGLIKVQK